MDTTGITGLTGADAVREATYALLSRGRRGGDSRHGAIARELTATTIRVLAPDEALIVRRDFDPRLAAAEALHLISGCDYGPRIRAITGHLGSRRWDGGRPTFALRMRDHLPWLIGELARHPDTRQAYHPLWDPMDLPHGWADYLCATGLQFLLRGGELELIVDWRSNDVWHGLPYNLFAFGQLQATVARVLHAKAGPLTFNVGSLHLYERHLDHVRPLQVREGRRVSGAGVWRERACEASWGNAARRAAMILEGQGPFDPSPSEAALAELLA